MATALELATDHINVELDEKLALSWAGKRDAYVSRGCKSIEKVLGARIPASQIAVQREEVN